MEDGIGNWREVAKDRCSSELLLFWTKPSQGHKGQGEEGGRGDCKMIYVIVYSLLADVGVNFVGNKKTA